MLIQNAKQTIDLNTKIQPFPGDSVATIGTENVFVSLKVRRLGATFELVTDLTIYYPISGHYEHEELQREIAEDEDEAIAIATDMEWDAQDKLNILDVTEYTKEPHGFPESLERYFDKARRVTPAVAAE